MEFMDIFQFSHRTLCPLKSPSTFNDIVLQHYRIFISAHNSFNLYNILDLNGKLDIKVVELGMSLGL